jgi:hypothetical protein
MRARYIGPGYGKWKGLDIFPGAELEIPDELAGMVSANPLWEVMARRGRPPKVQHDDED